MRVAAEVSPLELAEYQKAARLALRHPLITASYPDASALPLVRKWVRQLRTDLGEVLGYTLLSSGDTIRLRRVQDTLDGTRPAVTRARRPFDRRRYAYLVLALSALGRSGTQIALSELADAVAADAGRIDGVGMDTGRKPDRDAFVDAVAWLEARGALRMADGSAAEWVNDPERAEALYDIDREVVGAIYAPSRVLQHLNSVTELLDDRAGGTAPAQGREARRRGNARQARRLVLEHPVVYYADVGGELRGQLRSASLAEDVERLTGLALERRAEGVALVSAGQRFTDVAFPSTGTVAQSALLLCARIAGYLRHHSARIERLPAATAAERLAETARRIDAALPDRGRVASLLAGQALLAEEAERPEADDAGAGDAGARSGADSGSAEQDDAADVAYPFLSDVWLRTELRKLVDDFGAGMAEKQAADPGRLLAEAVALLASAGLVARVDGGVLVLPLLARYRSVTAQIKNPPPVTY
ncbi:MAG TPA: TIGR02678 family protein [Streptosporangiaceae bacterium]|nr:TIGR02678 family protein [Streptosporangiaceae bacterium]